MISNTHPLTEAFDAGGDVELNSAFKEARYQLSLLAILRDKADFLHSLATGAVTIGALTTSSLTVGVLGTWRASIGPANMNMVALFVGLVFGACVLVTIILVVRARTALQKKVIEAEIERLYGSLRDAEREVQRLRRKMEALSEEPEQ